MPCCVLLHQCLAERRSGSLAQVTQGMRKPPAQAVNPSYEIVRMSSCVLLHGAIELAQLARAWQSTSAVRCCLCCCCWCIRSPPFLLNSDAIKLHVSHFLTRTICPGTLPALWPAWLVFSCTQQQALQCLCQTPNIAAYCLVSNHGSTAAHQRRVKVHAPQPG
jgi:hypothetical protein